MKRPLLLLALILLLAFALRAWQLTGIPPGLTHDEANHGREALGVLDGVYLFYFPLNYGSEPLYSYTVALSMALFGEGLLALRLVNVIFGVAAIALTYLWASRAFDQRTALLSAALTAVSFWPLATSREALRAGMLPFFTALAVWFFWRIVERNGRSWVNIVGFGTAVALTLHIYLAARVAWLMFPAFLLYLALLHRPIFQRAWLSHADRPAAGRAAGNAHVRLSATAPRGAHPIGHARWSAASAARRAMATARRQRFRRIAGLRLARLRRPVSGLQHPRTAGV
jgi:4-amino-4-deoxy-L-arabinose transferase-like glycosyltransferase